MTEQVTAPVVSWPPTHEQRSYLAKLAALIRQFGAERFTQMHLVRADQRDFPETWERTPTAVHSVLYRLCWHAHWEPEIAIVDSRVPKPEPYRLLYPSQIELASAKNGVATFEIGEIGNDDVAGLLSHKIGQAFLELAPGDPFREAGSDISESAGSVAAVYLGFGVLVANSSMYRRYSSRIEGRSVREEQYIARAGGLEIGDATFLLAIQDIVREDAPDAYETLLKPQQEWLERWRDVLDEHEDELRTMLELDLEQAEQHELSRGDVPRRPQAHPERDLRKFNAGRPTFRVPVRGYWKAGLGVSAGILGFLLPFGVVVGPAAMAGLGLLGLLTTKRRFMCSDPDCSADMATEVDECPRCGGKIADTIPHQRDRLDRLDQLREEGKLLASSEDHRDRGTRSA